jgi:hypothetical protein
MVGGLSSIAAGKCAKLFAPRGEKLVMPRDELYNARRCRSV